VLWERLDRMPVCAPKAAFGEALGASGALCALTAGLALARRSVPPSALLSGVTDLDGDYALVNCFGCDGNNAALVLKGLK